MKTKKFLMTSLLVMGMIIAKAANGFPPELVLVSQPVLTYNTNSVTIYYDVQNIGDYTYRGDLYIYLDPDDGYYYAKKYMKVRPGRIRRVAVTIPAYRPNPSWVYTVMPYYELGDELYSFTTFEYFEPVRFYWYGPHNEPWVVINIGPRVRHYTRPAPYRYYYDGYYPILPPPPGGYPPGYYDGLHPLNPAHHTYAHHHSHGGYPANHHPVDETPGYNKPDDAAVVRPGTSNTPGSMSSRDPNAINGNNTNTNTNLNNNTGATTRPSNTNSSSGRTGNSSNTGTVTRPNNTGNNSGTTRPSGNSNTNSGRTGSGNVSRPNNNGNSSGTTRPSGNSNSNSGRSGSGNVSRPSGNSNSGRTGNSSSSSSSARSGSSSNSGRSGNSNNGGRTPSGPSRGR